MLTELAGIVEARFGVPVAAAPLAFAVGNGPGDILLAEDFLTIDDGCDIGDTRTKTVLAVLAGGIFGVVGSLDLEAEALGEEAQVELVLEVEVERIGALVRITEVIVVGEKKQITPGIILHRMVLHW